MKYGLHNALTAYYLKGWIKHFDWLVQPFSKCQYKSSLHNEDVVLIDLQVSLYEGQWYGSHGLVRYNAPLLDILEYVNNWCRENNRQIYLRLGHDSGRLYYTCFNQLIEYIEEHYKKTIILYEWYIEKPWELHIINQEVKNKVFERYWTLSWAKSEIKKHWWKFYLFLPIPWLWLNSIRKSGLKSLRIVARKSL